MRCIGDSIREAIDWTQDQLATTRPLAEHTLFALLDDGKVTETALGYVLCETTDEEETRKTLKHYRMRSRSHSHNTRGPRRHRKRNPQFKRDFERDDTDDTDDKDQPDALS